MDTPTPPAAVLLVEDHPELLHDVAALLASDGFVPIAVPSVAAAHAVLKLRAQPPELAVIDVGLPDGCGFDLAAALMTLDVGVVFLTARRSMDDRLKGLSIGDAYLTKPIDARELAGTLRAVLRRRRRTRAGATDGHAPSLPGTAPARDPASTTTALSAATTLGWRGPVDRRGGLAQPASAAPSESPPSPVPTGGAWRLVRNWWTLRRDGHPAELGLSANERAILLTLSEHAGAPGTPVSRNLIAHSLGLGEDWYDSRRLEVTLSRLRNRTLHTLGAPLPVITIRGQGYALDAPLLRDPRQGDDRRAD